MDSSRLKRLAIIAVVLVALSGIATGSAFAGTLAANTRTFAHEIATSATSLTAGSQVYTMGIPRNAGESFIIRWTLSTGLFASTTPSLAFSTPASVQTAYRAGGVGAAFIEFDVQVLVATVVGDTFTLGGAAPIFYRFPAASAIGATTTMTVDLRDVFGAIDTVGVFTKNFAVLKAACVMTATTDTATTVNSLVLPPRTQFLPSGAGNDADTSQIAKAFLQISKSTAGVVGVDGVTDYSLTAADSVTVTVTGDFTGVSQFAWDVTGNAAIGTSGPDERFTVNATLTSATITVTGDQLGVANTAVFFTKVAATALNAPRTFGVSATIAPAASSQARTLDTSNAQWWQWQNNAVVMTSPYITFSPGNDTKFRFTNSSSADITVIPQIVTDQGTFTLNLQSFVIPAGGSVHVELSATPATGTGAVGPLATLLTGTQPVRGKAVFTVLSATNNVAGMTLIASPTGVITLYMMQQIPQAGN